MTTTEGPVPRARGLDAALGGVRGAMATLDRFRTTPETNAEGGDPAHHASPALLVRHTVNYLLAADVADAIIIDGPVLDVGSGVGAFSSWLGRRLERDLHIVDHDAKVLQLARRSFVDITTHRDLAGAPQAAVVTAMEVIEHLHYNQQAAFVRGLIEHVTPGGVLIMSTPDECSYMGGWSGYAPHIGTLDAPSLRTLVRTATRLPVDVWRIDGPGFRLARSQRVIEPLANRLWASVQRTAPQLTGRLTDLVGRRRRGRTGVFGPTPDDDDFTVAPATDAYRADGTGTGLLAVVHVPAN